jgi:mevalonate kinase
LEKPFELAQFALGAFTDSMRVTLPHGVKLRVHSDIPVGCGMGSSAATILSVMSAISHYLQLPLNNDVLYKLALEAENMQHGHSSGLDLRVAMHGGCIYLHDGVMEMSALPALSMCLINTGTPASSTGQCVESVAPLFQSGSLGDDFGAVTRSLRDALQANDHTAMVASIRANQQLLTRLGVVPEPVQAFIRELEQTGAAAKICGAGAVIGDQAGIVLVITDDKEAVSARCVGKGYEMMQIACEPRGVYVV